MFVTKFGQPISHKVKLEGVVGNGNAFF
jgi:hypothetical protein